MEKAVLIIALQLSGQQAYRIYELNTKFSAELGHRFEDGARLLLTNESGRTAFLKPLWTQHRKLGEEFIGLHRNITDQIQSATIVGNLRQSIADGTIDLPDAIKHLLRDSDGKECSWPPIYPQLN